MADKSLNPYLDDDDQDVPVELTLGVPTDPRMGNQWHLATTGWSINVQDVWLDYTGQGVTVGAVDDGFQFNHPDLSANYDTTRDWSYDGSNNASPKTADDSHGTAVMGLIGADDNGTGGVGVAFDTTLIGYQVNFSSGSFESDLTTITSLAVSNVDVLNNSWGYSGAFADNFNDPGWGSTQTALVDLVSLGRGGLGISTVFAGGNERTLGDDSNHHNMTNSPYVIAVGATDTDGTYASFSTPGANLLVATPGVGVETTDRTGSDGFDASSYTSFSGTSAAAPILSGVVALIYDANPDLGYRDVQEILAYSAQHNDAAAASWTYNGATNWNGGGLHFSNDYGFGLVDATAAVRLAETWQGQQTYANMQTRSASASPNVAIPDEGSVSADLSVAGSIEIEHVLIDVNIDHTWAGDLSITLTSPGGTVSTLADRPDGGYYNDPSGINFTFASNAFWGEDSAGTWTLDVTDNAAQDTGTLISWGLQFLGNAHAIQNTYVFTDSFGDFTGAELTARSTITDTNNGIDTLNLAAVTSPITLDLTPGAGGTIAGKSVSIAAGTLLENVYGGDGDDTITGNDSNNLLYGGRGADTLTGGNGADTLYGHDGNDNLSGGASQDTLYGGTGNDVIDGGAVGDYLYGEDGDDTINGGAGGDFIQGGNGVDDIDGYTGADTIYGNDGDDNIVTGAGNDTAFGNTGNDYITGMGGVDLLRGNDGNDTIFAGVHGDTVFGDAGNDYINGNNGDDNLYGGLGADTIFGGRDNDFLYGEEQGDRLTGGFGDDTLDGGAGNDRLYGDVGVDSLTGGTGADDFAFWGGALDLGVSVDTVTDFTLGQGDQIWLMNVLSGYDPMADLITDFVQITDDGTDSFLAIDTNGGADNFVQLATLLNVTGLTDEQNLLDTGVLFIS